eukprot:snap_masked-scaffold_2-processed-gene-16.15-mRNA-1 protein AED:0.12 eAED:0.12 QI:0/-1/0/1/-1/1/1/0/273
MSQRLLNQVAVITGSGSGVGRAASILFAQEGISGLVLADLNKSGLEATLKEIPAEIHPKVILTPVDVSKEDQVKSMIEKAEEKFGKVNIVFNNAGIMDSEDSALDTDASVFDKTFDINVKGVFYGCKYGIPAMLRAGGGSVINVASFVGHLGAATPQIAYTCSKGAVAAMTKELSAVYARQNVRVNNLCPGPLNTELLQKFLNTEEKRQRRLVQIPMGRFGEADEMAKAALFLASKESSFVTGASLFVDGGITSCYVTPEEKIDPFGGPNLNY